MFIFGGGLRKELLITPGSEWKRKKWWQDQACAIAQEMHGPGGGDIYNEGAG